MDADIFVPLIIFTFLFLSLKTFLGYRQAKLEHSPRTAEGEGSLRTSELKALIREAVEEANEPLLARLEALEDREGPTSRLLPPAEDLWDEVADMPSANPVPVLRAPLAR